MEDNDFRLDRLTAALLARDARLREMLLRTNAGGPHDGRGRAPYLLQGAERLRVEDEHRHIAELMLIAGV